MYARYVPPPKAKPDGGTSPSRAPLPEPEPASQHVAPPPAAQGRTTQTPYARYIPPPKKTEPKRTNVPPPPPATPNPTPSQPRRIVFNYDEDDAPVPTRPTPYYEEDDGNERKRKRAKTDVETPKSTDEKKDGKKERRKKEKDVKTKAVEPESQSPETARPSTLDQTEPVAVADEQPGEVLEKKERREKKKKKEKKAKATNNEVVEDGDVEMQDARDVDGAVTEAVVQEKKTKEKAVESRHKSVLEKKEKSLQQALAAAASLAESERSNALSQQHAPEEEGEVHGLEPLPQPAPAVIDTSTPLYETLPPWLARPVQVSPDTRAAWTSLGFQPELGVSPVAAQVLATKGYKEAFAVQTAVVPRLLPAPMDYHMQHGGAGDLVISAATGSGKTLAYVLPLVRDISYGAVTKLRALIVVPTRELVRQVQEVCEACAIAFAEPGRKRVRIGTAVGNQTFAKEQLSLVDGELRYDPEGYARLVEERKWANLRRREEEDPDFDMLELLDTPLPLVQHVVERTSKVDVLICTPGRLVEHMERTPGFNLDYVRWLVVDEADKLLEQSFQQWLDVVMQKLSVEKAAGTRDFPMQSRSGVRKVILSATMPRNISLLSKLRLRRPELIFLTGGATVTTEDSAAGDREQQQQQQSSSYELALPELLQESAIKIRDPEQKPLYLVDLLNGGNMRSARPGKLVASPLRQPKAKPSEEESDTSSSGSDSGSSSSSSATSSDEDSDEDEDSGEDKSEPATKIDTVLIFTKSNETALRLSRLLEILSPNIAPLIGTLASTTRTSERRKVLRAFTAGKLRILVASDLVARGLDLRGLDHVVNYDMPPSVRAYVHRVGRTARAGTKGRAWTFFTKTEAGWFFAEVAGLQQGSNSSSKRAAAAAAAASASGGEVSSMPIRRSGKVEIVKVTARRSVREWERSTVVGDFSEERLAEYERALAELGREAKESREK